jgi:polar amino acid transport system substrate-binding protein
VTKQSPGECAVHGDCFAPLAISEHRKTSELPLQDARSTPARRRGFVRFLLAALTLLALASPCAAQSLSAPGNDHQAAVAALSDLKAAIATIVSADASYSTNRDVYHQASQRAINALEGTRGEDYRAEPGNPGDQQGAIGHIDALLNRAATPVWAAPLHGAEANLRAAVAHLQDSLHARELMDYELSVSRALAYLEVAQGRPTETGVLAGLEGALANTALGVPTGARMADACAAPPDTPAFGTRDGYIAWVSVPAAEGTHALAENPGGTDVTVQGNMIVLRTAAAPLVAKACSAHAAGTAAPSVTPAAQHAAASAPAEASLPALYTIAQAEQGAQIFVSKCVSCHGVNMQGTAAPSVAGNDFLTTAEHNGWTLGIIRYLVFKMMPFNAPGSLSPNAYASVIAFLLASNCYPAGNTPFPTEDSASFAKIKLAPVPDHPAGQNSQGVCKLP